MNEIHLVSFDVPYPPNYGGVSEVFYRIKALHGIGVRIHLHCYESSRSKSHQLNEYCESISYYPRNRSFLKQFGWKPFIVLSRNDPQLLENLKKRKYPILFEGLHSTYFLNHPDLKDHRKLLRAHNNEHEYYRSLARLESGWLKTMYYRMESSKLKHYEKKLHSCAAICSISLKDQKHFSNRYPETTHWLPSFHGNKRLRSLEGKGYFALYHANLAVNDNLKSALFLIDVFSSIDYPLVITGKTDDKKLLQLVDKHKNISFIPLDDKEQLVELMKRAHINVFYSFQSAGMKTRLLQAAFNSRFTLCNSKMVEGSGLESICSIANDPQSFRKEILRLAEIDYDTDHLDGKQKALKNYRDTANARRLSELLFNLSSL